MKINTIRIHNFRSIVDVSLSLHDYTLIVGANNAGKSNLVSAVRCFYDGLKFEADRDSPKVNCGTDRDAESYVQIDFVDVNVKVELGVWTGKSQKGVFRIRRYLSSSNEKWTNCYCLVNVDGTVSDKVKPQRKLPEGFGTLTYIPSMSKPSEDIRTTGPSALRDLVGDIFNETLERNKKYLKLKRPLRTFLVKFVLARIRVGCLLIRWSSKSMKG